MPYTIDSSTWILVANGSEAKLFKSAHLGKDLELLNEFDHPSSRDKTSDLISDKSGHFASNGTEAHGSFVEHNEPKTVEMEKFAQSLAQTLEQGRTTNKYTRLIVISPPGFHGMLRKHCNDHIKNLVVSHLEKDYTKMVANELNGLLAELPKF